MSQVIYSASGISVKFGISGKEPDVEALHDLNFEVKEGEFLTVIGPSGCGKTTLLRLMSGLHKPTKGELLFRGEKLNGPRPGIGMAFQDPLLLPWRNVIKNVLLPIEILGNQMDYATATAMDLITTVGLAGFEKSASWQLSGGMRQRVNLCRALITSPQVLLLDEPFGALDAFTREELWLVLQTLHLKEQCTVILVTHQLNEAVFLSDRVIVLSNRPGKIIHEEILRLPKPRKLDIAYTEEFITHVGTLRNKIVR